MFRGLLALALLLPVAACDSTASEDDGFSLEVTVTDPAGAPLAGYDVHLAYNATAGAAEGPAPHASQAAGSDAWMAAPYPNPWSTVARVEYDLPAAASPARIELFDLTGALRWQRDVPGGPGRSSTVLYDDSTRGLAGGVYRVVGTFGTTVLEAWTIHSDAFGGASGWVRALGATAPDGTVRTDDRSVAPGLFAVPPIVRYNSEGDALGQIPVQPEVTLEVYRDGTHVASQPVSLRDGANRVSVVVAAD